MKTVLNKLFPNWENYDPTYVGKIIPAIFFLSLAVYWYGLEFFYALLPLGIAVAMLAFFLSFFEYGFIQTGKKRRNNGMVDFVTAMNAHEKEEVPNVQLTKVEKSS